MTQAATAMPDVSPSQTEQTTDPIKGAPPSTLRSPRDSPTLEILVCTFVAASVVFFFQGGGWNQNAHFATTVALIETGSLSVDRYSASTGDLAFSPTGRVSAKPVATSLVAIPAYLLGKLITLPCTNHGNAVILRAYITTAGTSGLALILFALAAFRLVRRRLGATGSAAIALALALATPLLPNATMLTSHPLAALSALLCLSALDKESRGGRTITRRTLFVAGVAAGACAAFEYMLAILILPFALWAYWQTRHAGRRVVFFLGGTVLPLSVPVLHHILAYGNPFHVGYASLENAQFAAAAAHGWFGFDGFSPGRLFELTFGQIRGFFFLSPFLIASVPGVIRLLRDKHTRPLGLISGVGSWGIVLTVSCLFYWHSGSAVGSRYALPFVAFCAIPIAVLWNEYKPWLAVGMGWGAGFMLMATAVTAIPPTPGNMPYENVFYWLWTRFSVGKLASWQQPILIEAGVGDGQPTMPFAFNLGQLLGLPGLWSLAPLIVVWTALAFGLVRALRTAHAADTDRQ